MAESFIAGVFAGYTIAIPVGAIAVLILEIGLLGLNITSRLTTGDKLLFVVRAFLASWSWQTVLALIGAVARRHFSSTFRNLTGIVGNFMIIGFGIKILM
jgi:arginine exporter protein ArgO